MTYVQSRLPDEPSPFEIRRSISRRVLLDTLLQGLAFDVFLPLFTAAELSKMLVVSRKFNDTINAYRRRLHDIDKLLLMFFTLTEIRLFRDIQSLDGFLISGSMAVQYFAGVVWPISDMDIYCYPQNFTRLVRLLRRIGYGYVPYRGSSADLSVVIQSIRDGAEPFNVYRRGKTISAVLNFTRRVKGSFKKIQVVVCKHSPIEAILNFHSTVVMNFIGPTHAVCLYPYSTLHLFEAIRMVATETAASAFKKYVRRGWDLVGCSSALGGLRRASEVAYHRAVGDAATWIIPIQGIGVPFDAEQLHLKWLLSHSWSHVKGIRGVMRIVLHVGGRCSWRWPLTFATVCQHLRFHGSVPPVTCNVCGHENITYEDIYDLVHESVESSPCVGDTEVDRFAANFLHHAFSNMPFFGPISRDFLPGADVSMSAFVQVKAIVCYFRSEPTITVAFHKGQPAFVLTSLHVYINVSLAVIGRTVALLKSSNSRRPKAGSGLSFKLVFTNARALCFSAEFVMPKVSASMSAPTPTDRPTMEDLRTIEHFINDTVRRVPQRIVGNGEVVPVLETKQELMNSLSALFSLLKCRPDMVARYSSTVGRTDIHAFTEITVRLPEDWPELETTALTLQYSGSAVDRLYRLGFAVNITKGGRLFM
ncbi:hypothetical protein V5O48_003718 [Marasmius crinis-equi]|uniref:F-box domain-containing protein n=1 Tax=Marasmius crinis-equi TaxID=585013 RepID=A0ABR3FSA6_9AGAR